MFYLKLLKSIINCLRRSTSAMNIRISSDCVRRCTGATRETLGLFPSDHRQQNETRKLWLCCLTSWPEPRLALAPFSPLWDSLAGISGGWTGESGCGPRRLPVGVVQLFSCSVVQFVSCLNVQFVLVGVSSTGVKPSESCHKRTRSEHST